METTLKKRIHAYKIDAILDNCDNFSIRSASAINLPYSDAELNAMPKEEYNKLVFNYKLKIRHADNPKPTNAKELLNIELNMRFPAKSHKKFNDWYENCGFPSLEKITGLNQYDFSEEDGYQDFVDACDKYWYSLTMREKQNIFNELK